MYMQRGLVCNNVCGLPDLPRPPLETDPGVSPMCDVMGGRSFTIASSKELQQCLDNINHKVQRHGVYVPLWAAHCLAPMAMCLPIT